MKELMRIEGLKMYFGGLKAIDGFDESFGTRFSTYAVPKIAGEIRRFLRDDGYGVLELPGGELRRELGSIPGLGRSLGGRHGNPLQYSCLENPMDRGAWWATYSPWGHRESDTTEQLTHMVAS